MTDQEFLEAFENCALDEFRHKEHIRMAWCYLKKYGAKEGAKFIVTGIKNFASCKNQDQLYHETITTFWIQAVEHHIQENSVLQKFSEFSSAVPELLNSKLIYRHYSPTLLQGDESRNSIVRPDLRPLPNWNP